MSVDSEYFQMLNKLELAMNRDNAEKIEKKLDELYDVKPVRLKWFILKAKVTKLLGKDTSQIRDILLKKYRLLYNSDKFEEVANSLIELTEDKIEQERFLYHIELKNNKTGKGTIVSKKQDEYNMLVEKYMSDSLSQQEFETLISNCYIRNDFLQYILFHVVYEKTYNNTLDIIKWVLEMPHMELHMERLKDYKNKNYIVIENEKNNFNSSAVIKALKFLGNNVFYLDKALIVDMPDKINVSDTMPISFENAEQKEDCIVVHPVRLVYEDGTCEDNIEYLVDSISNNIAEDKLTIIYSSGFVADDLCKKQLLKKTTERMSLFSADYLEGNLNISWSGDYLSYISEIYKYDVHESINRKGECDFSIVLPVSNNIDTFKYTLQTCLDVHYAGSYEILVSDNSINGSTVVYDYVQQINDKRIKYYKTPRALQLAKSFEFAFLQAKGEFIFSIGADDGVLPWCLDVLKTVLEKVPEDEVILWDRGFYAWPGFNKGQQNQFIIPKGYQKNNINISSLSCPELLMAVINNSEYMYAMPLLYINSGFRRSYLKTLIEKSGRMWDGHNQDIYMGVLNICINSKITRIDYPLTIAGMSDRSIGKDSNIALGHLLFTSNKYMNLISCSPKEFIVPHFGGDISALYRAILRIAARGLLSDEFVKKVFGNMKPFEYQMTLLNKENEMYDEYVSSTIECIIKNDNIKTEEFLEKWFDKLYLPIQVKENNNTTYQGRFYDVGFTQNGGLMLDASDFGVRNIHEAVGLFKKIIGSY